MDTRRTGWFCVSCTKTGIILLQCTIPTYNIPMLWSNSDERDFQLCAIFGGTRFFSQAGGRFKGGWVVYREEGGKSWGLYSFSPDVLYPCWYEFIILYPCGDDAVKIIHYFLFPESEFPEGNFALFWTWPECTRQKYIIICKLVVALTYHCLRMSTSHNFRTNNSRRHCEIFNKFS